MSNWNHKLSIIGLVYDGNEKYLKGFLEYTKRVRLDHEVIIVDNRDNKDSPLIASNKDIRIINAEHNLGILDGRRKGFEHSSGDYVWFVDIDDEIFDVIDDDYGDYDVISFNFKDDVHNRYLGKSGVITGEEVCSSNTLLCIYFYIWNKWFKRDVVEKTYKEIPEFFCVYKEDTLFVTKALEYANTVYLLKGDCVFYNHIKSEDSTTLKKISTEKEVDLLFEGFDKVVELEEKSKIKKSSYNKHNIKWYIELASNADDNIKPYFIKKLITLFTYEYVSTLIKNYFQDLIQFLPEQKKLKCSYKEDLLSIVILFCDKDYKYIPSLLQNIQDNVKIQYEVVLIDNREKEKRKKLNIDKYKCILHKFGYNATQIQGRKKGIELSNGKYIWFIDADDSVNVIDNINIKDLDYDVIVFNEYVKNERIETRDLLNFYKVREFCVALWDKWIKKEVLEKVESHIPANLYGSASEDVLLFLGSLKYSKSLYACKKRIYNYDIDRSSCCCGEITDIETFKRSINGHDKISNCINIMLTDKEMFSIRNLFSNEGGFFFKRLTKCSCDIIDECFDIYAQYFNEDEIIQAWKLHIASEKITRQKYEKIKSKLQERFKDRKNDLIFYGNKTYYQKNENGELIAYKKERAEILPPFADD